MPERFNSRLVGLRFNGRDAMHSGRAGQFNAISTPSGRYRQRLNNILAFDGTTVANYRADTGVTGVLNASALANQIGIAGPLLQATGANQPIVLAYSGQKYAANFGVNGNGFTSPNSAGSTLTGDMSSVVTVALNSVAPAAANVLGILQVPAAGQYNHEFLVQNGATGRLVFAYSTDGTAQVVKVSSATLASVGLAAGQLIYLGVYHDVDNGAAGNDVKFYWSLDKITWTQLGATQTTAGAVTRKASTGALSAWAETTALGIPLNGKGYRSELYSGFYAGFGAPGAGAGAATLVADFNASDWPETTTNGATQASSTTGEVWTLNNTGAKLAQIVGSSQLLFDGAAGFMKAATFPFVQPEFVINVLKPITWTDTDQLYDGNSGTERMVLTDTVGTPNVGLFASAGTVTSANLPLNAYAIHTALFSGADSYQSVNGVATATANPGTHNANGFTLGSRFGGDLNANIQVKEIILLNAVPSAAKLAQIISLLNSIHGVF